jgi:redox-sensitive bicupin YhaK (pirin superfamily)
MFQIRRSSQRGHFNHGWLDTYHTFSFGDYFDPSFINFATLRVMNEDHVAPGTGFGMHPHRDMEIITYVLSGELQHRDSLGNGEILKAGEVQTMSAGKGILHSEFNPSRSQEVHLYQLWIMPRQKGLESRYAQKPFDPEGRRNRWQRIVSPTGEDGSLSIQQEASIFLANLEGGHSLDYRLHPQRSTWLQLLRGEVELNGENLHAGDGVAIHEENQIELRSQAGTELMLFDLR